MNTELKPRVTLEELFKLKRAERPPREFWVQFEGELRAKQLAAIMERPPLWSRLGDLWRAALRHPVPIGAASALAMAWAGFHEFRPAAAHAVALRPAPASAPQSAVSGRQAALLAASDEPDVARTGGAATSRVRTVALRTAGTRSEPGDDAAVEVAAMRLLTGEAPVLRAQPAAWERNLFAAAVATPAPQSMALVAEREPLARMQPPPDDMRARLLDDGLPNAAPAPADASVLTGHVLSGLSDERLYRTISRYGVEGDHVLIKF